MDFESRELTPQEIFRFGLQNSHLVCECLGYVGQPEERGYVYAYIYRVYYNKNSGIKILNYSSNHDDWNSYRFTDLNDRVKNAIVHHLSAKIGKLESQEYPIKTIDTFKFNIGE